ncbi:MAG: HAMP domain-containing histidine kinase [Ruminococcus sp.]|nr:HAMP domain-containing histidine kinase [Ruminococcus sp.]
MKKSAKEIADGFAEKLHDDTNTTITISSYDKDMRALADSVNKQLKLLRSEHLRYEQGNTELVNAITNISHDLRTPLTAILGYLDLINKTDDEAKKEEYLGIISERAEMMKQLTEELFKYSVVISQENGEQQEEVYVNQLLEESLAGFFPALTQKGITPDINITHKRVIRTLNKSALSRIFSNLLTNAVKYSGGDLSVSLSEDGEIRFSNTAKGLSAVSVEQLFDRFYTVETARNSTGLGLSIAKTLVQRMGGSITAEYENDKLTIIIRL